MFAQDSINLRVTLGIAFKDHAARGIDPLHFDTLIMVSDLVLNNLVNWVSFYSSYNVAYLLQVLSILCLYSDPRPHVLRTNSLVQQRREAYDYSGLATDCRARVESGHT